MKKFALFASLLLIFAGGCGQVSQGVDGKISNAEAGVSGDSVSLKDFDLTLPKDWKVFDLSAKDLENIVKETESKSPDQKGLTAQVMAAAKNGMIKLFAFDFNNSDKDFVNNMNAIVIVAPAGATMEQVEKGSKDEIEKYTGTPAAEGKFGDYSTLEYSMIGPDKSKLVVKAYMAMKADKVYTFTFTCRPKYRAKFFATADKVVKSVSLK